jgi:hypothetical protein
MHQPQRRWWCSSEHIASISWLEILAAKKSASDQPIFKAQLGNLGKRVVGRDQGGLQ